MALRLQTRVVGDAEVKARFLRTGDALRTRLREALIRLGVETRDLASSYAPRRKSRQPKNRKYGPLYKSIPVKFSETDDTMRVRVGKPVFYGEFVEDGVNEKTVTITNKRTRQHERGVLGLGMRKRKDGTMRAYVRRGITKRGYATSAYTKRVRVPPQPFMGPALATMRERALARLGAAAAEAVEA